MSEPSGSPLGETEVSRMAGSTGLEPAASGVTGRRSNQLNYDPNELQIANCQMQIAIVQFAFCNSGLGGTGFEPVTAGV